MVYVVSYRPLFPYYTSKHSIKNIFFITNEFAGYYKRDKWWFSWNNDDVDFDDVDIDDVDIDDVHFDDVVSLYIT